MMHVIKTRLFVGVGKKRHLTRATNVAKSAIKRNGEFRAAKKPCPMCGFEHLLVAKVSGNLLCFRCHLMAPGDRIFSVKTGRRVRF